MKPNQITGRDIWMARLLTVCILSFAVIFTFHFRPLYYAEIRALDLPGQTGMTEEEIRANYDAVIDYNSLFSRGELELPTLAMSEEGRIHFADVRRLVVSIETAGLLCAVLFLGSLFLPRKKRGSEFLLLAGIASALLPLILGALALLCWDQVFIAFHRIFFRNDYWMFNPVTDPIITILPDRFFLHAALLLFEIILLGCVFCVGLWRRLSHRRGRENCNPTENEVK